MTDPRLIVMLERICETPDEHRLRPRGHPSRAPADPVEPEDPIEKLAMRPRTTQALARDGVRTVRDLTARSARDLRYTPQLGPMSICEIVGTLSAHGLRLRDHAPQPRANAHRRRVISSLPA